MRRTPQAAAAAAFCDERKNKTSTEYYSEVKEKQESKEKRWLSNGKLKKTL
jgi:hypothetical protein